MRVVITGSNGFVGSNLVTTLRRDAEIEIFPFDLGATEEALENALAIPGDPTQGRRKAVARDRRPPDAQCLGKSGPYNYELYRLRESGCLAQKLSLRSVE